jgi:arabinofuranan 3-O-arabinosyltransferase
VSQTDQVPADAAPNLGGPASPDRRKLGYFALAFMAYVPPLLTQPGKVAADTKQYLYLDPSRLLGRAASMWDPNIGFGTVTHQNIGYLFPMGPYYWLLQALRVPDWVAQRLWLGSLVFFAGLGVLYLMRTLGVKGPGVAVAAVAYMFSPYSLDYAARISVLLLTWAGLGWMIALTIKALRDGRWRYPALFALVVQVVGGVNATALIFAGVGPVLWIVYSCVTGQVTLRRALNVTAKIGGLTLLTSLWWMAGLWAQGSYGLDILKYTETVKAVSRTSTPNEVLRGLGYWFFYGQDSVGPWTEASINYTQHVEVILAGYGLAALALAGAAFARWRHRAFFLVMTFIGVVIAVGAYPYNAPTPLGSLFKAFANSSAAGLALRSTGRAIPLVTLGMAVLLGIGVNAAAQRFTTPRNPKRGLVIAGAVVALIVVDFPALYDGTYYGRNLERPEKIPSYWIQATRYLDQGSHQTRVLELPGSDFASYVWGNTVDPITPGLMDRPYVARELIPWGGPAPQDLLNAVDERIQQGTFEPGGFTALARRMGVGAVDIRYDLQFKRYNTVRPLDLQRDFEAVPGLTLAKTFGSPLHGQVSTEFVDETTLAASPNDTQPPDVAVYTVADPTQIVRTESGQRPLVVAGDGEGLVDIANVGLLDNAGVVLYSASYAQDPAALRKAIGSDGVLVVTDSNRKRARRWSTVTDNVGYTEQAGEKPLAVDLSDARLDDFPKAGDNAFTVTDQQGVTSVQATAYGNPITYTPEDRATRAFDGNTDTSWSVAAFDLAIGNRIQLVTKKPITTDRVRLVQKQTGSQNRWITQVRLTFDGGHPVIANLDPTSRIVAGQTVLFPKQTFSKLDIEIANTSDGRRALNRGAVPVGFAEIDVQDEHSQHPIRVRDVERMPLDLLAAEGPASQAHALVFLMSRERVLPVPPRTDEELSISREFTLPTARTFSLTGTARLTPDTKGAVIDAALGLPTEAEGGVDARAREFLFGCVRCRSDDAIDGDPSTAWVTPFIGVRRQFVSYQIARPITFDHMNLQIVADKLHSRPTLLELTVDGQVRWIKLPELPVHEKRNSVDSVVVHFPAVTGNHIAVKIASIREVRTASRDSKPLAPVGIAELGIPGLRLPPQPAQLPGTCRSDLLRIDGRPVPVRIIGSSADAESLKPLTIETCDPADPSAQPTVQLAPGAHELDTKSGQLTALQLDRLVLASAPGGGAGTTAAGKLTGLGGPLTAPKLTISHQGRTKMQVKVTGATAPFWLVLGESQNAGWRATVQGVGSLGGSQLVDGFANGWRIDPKGKESLVVDLEWMPQQRVWVAIALSLLGGLLCCALAAAGFWRARRRVVALEGAPDAGPDRIPVFAFPWLPAGEAPAVRTQVLATVAGAAVAAMVAGLWAGALVGVALVVAFCVPRGRAFLAAAPPLLVGLIGLYVAYKQVHASVPPVFEWPTLFSRATAPAWAAIVLFFADAVYELVTRGRRSGGLPEAGGRSGVEEE